MKEILPLLKEGKTQLETSSQQGTHTNRQELLKETEVQSTVSKHSGFLLLLMLALCQLWSFHCCFHALQCDMKLLPKADTSCVCYPAASQAEPQLSAVISCWKFSSTFCHKRTPVSSGSQGDICVFFWLTSPEARSSKLAIRNLV